MNGLKKSGVWPADISVFTDDDFRPSAPTDIRLPESSRPNNCDKFSTPQEVANQKQTYQNDDNTPPESIKTISESFLPNNENESIQPQCSWTPGITPEPAIATNISAFQTASPQLILPIPEIQQDEKRHSKKRGRTTILTSFPYLEELKTAKEERRIKEIKKVERAKRKLDSPKESDAAPAKKEEVLEKKKLTEKKLKNVAGSADPESDSDDSGAECSFNFQ
ncbi:hypothetical protein JTB14_032605 [Gonioctena quinquepunctata]|nr:hypothetical protein JTB14_032605 [Gonioctena quinquepunctata]